MCARTWLLAGLSLAACNDEVSGRVEINLGAPASSPQIVLPAMVASLVVMQNNTAVSEDTTDIDAQRAALTFAGVMSQVPAELRLTISYDRGGELIMGLQARKTVTLRGNGETVS